MWRNTGGCRVGNVCLLLSRSQITIISNCILNTVLIPSEKCTSNPSSQKLLFEAVCYRKHIWSKCRELTVGYPAPTDTSATQPLQAQERHKSEGRNITGARGPICLCRDCIFYIWQESYSQKILTTCLPKWNLKNDITKRYANVHGANFTEPHS